MGPTFIMKSRLTTSKVKTDLFVLARAITLEGYEIQVFKKLIMHHWNELEEKPCSLELDLLSKLVDEVNEW